MEVVDLQISGIRDVKLISMFAGCGGLDLGFRGGFEYRGEVYPSFGFELLRAYDSDRKAVDTYRMNVDPNAEVLDLSDFDAGELPRADILVGGFPCQDFSSCGPRRGLQSDRGQLFMALVRYLSAHRPAMFVAENVKNLEFMQKGAVLAHIVEAFAECGYNVRTWRLFAPDHGVPQMRTRLFIVGVRNDMDGFPEPPEPIFAGRHRGIAWAIDDLKAITDESMPNQSQYFKAARAKKGNGQGDEKARADLPGYTVRANAKSRIQFHYELERRLTVRECARLQTFPDDFVFPYSNSQNVKMIGNAVPPVLAHRVAGAVADFLSSSLSPGLSDAA